MSKKTKTVRADRIRVKHDEEGAWQTGITWSAWFYGGEVYPVLTTPVRVYGRTEDV